MILNGLVYLLLNLVIIPKTPELLDNFVLHKLAWFSPAKGQPMPLQSGEVVAVGDAFKPLQLVTHFFAHIGFLHILFNMLALFSIGTPVELVMGSRRFLQYYLICGVLGGLLIATLDPSPNPVLGASGAVAGTAVAFALFFPQNELLIFPIPFPIKAWKLVLGYGVFSFVMVVINPVAGGISHFAHLSGMLVAVGYFFVTQRMIRR